MTDIRDQAFDAYQAGDFQAAEAGYRKALSADPADVNSRMTLGVVLRRLGRLDESLEMLEQALADAPRDFRAHANYGLALQTARRLDDAISAYRAAYRLEPRVIRQISVNLAALGTGMIFLDPAELETFLGAD